MRSKAASDSLSIHTRDVGVYHPSSVQLSKTEVFLLESASEQVPVIVALGMLLSATAIIFLILKQVKD